jgi:uncharacterized protein (DUF1778 family)
MRVEIPSRARAGLTIRVSADERSLLEAAAARRPEYLTRYIRLAALEVARREVASERANGHASTNDAP